MTITTNWVQNVYLYTNTTIYELNNPSQRRRGYNQVKNEQSCRVSTSKKMRKNHSMVPLWIIFKGKIKIAHLLPGQSAPQDDHFLQT